MAGQEQDMIDITPPGMKPQPGKGAKGKERTVFQQLEWHQILRNPERLTKEGIEEKIRYWNFKCHNKHMKLKYQTMLKRCQEIEPSEKTDDGQIVLAKNPDGSPRWVKPKEEGKKSKKSKESKTKSKSSKSSKD